MVNRKVKIVIARRIESTNVVLNMQRFARDKYNKDWYEEINLAIRSQLSAEELQYFRDRLGEKVKYILTFTARYRRLIDQTNIFVKPVEDGLKGILITDDSPKYIQDVIIKQEKIKPGKHPDTVIEVELIEN